MVFLTLRRQGAKGREEEILLGGVACTCFALFDPLRCSSRGGQPEGLAVAKCHGQRRWKMKE